MKQLVIDKIGPIDHVELRLKRVNVVIGPQSTGKSCILKIACFCAWAEKRIQMEQDQNGFGDFGYVEDALVRFHKMGGFIKNGSRISYKTEHLSFVVDFDKRSFRLKWAGEAKRYSYRRLRVSYIPAERNLVAAIPNWFDVKMDSTNLKSFISDWSYAHKLCDEGTQLPVLNLGVTYYYDKRKDRDYIVLDNGEKMELENASSGLQSVIPMWVYLDYLFRKQYAPNEMSSMRTESENEEIAQHIYDSKFCKTAKKAGENNNLFFGKVGVTKRMFASEDDFKEFKSMVQAYTQTCYSDIYLEEPEQNLFPETQLELVYELLRNSSLHNDGLFIATHSPYILYAINNCMLGYRVKDRIPTEMESLRQHEASWIDPKNVAVWEIRDGKMYSEVDTKHHTLQDSDGLIRGNYFDRIMRSVMADFTNYSVFYD